MNPPPPHARAAHGQQVDVLVAGAGPCGLMLANELGLRGISCLVVDPKPSTAYNPQANATQARTMEHFRRIGIAARIRSLGLPPDHPTDIAYFTRFARHELARLRLPTAAQAGAQVRRLGGAWSAAELPHRVAQKYVEAVLHESALRHAGNEIRFGWRLQEFTDTAQGIEALIGKADGSAATPVRAQFLVGADGARGLVRGRLGIHYSGDTGVTRQFMGGKMFAVYLRAPAFYGQMPHGRAWMYVAVNAQRRGFICTVDGQGEFALHAAVRPDETPEDWTHEDARRIFAQASGMDIPFEILSTGIWTAGHSLVAQRYQQGRVFIAGDAAHLFTPTGGLGYNTAVGDAVNLGWKLASVVRGPSSLALMDSYEAERRPIGIRNTGYARHFADSVGLYAAPEAIEQDGPAGEAARAAAGEVLDRHVRLEFNIPGVTFGERYDGSPLVVADGGDIPPDSANDYQPTTTPGGRLPHLWLQDGTQSLYDLLGFEWTVLAAPDGGAQAQRMAKQGAASGLAVKLLVLPSPALQEMLQDQVLVVRPDQMVAWRGRHADDAQAVWAKVAALPGR